MSSDRSRQRRIRTSAETREHILEIAGDLFYREGIRATGIDRVASAADVAPTTLYRLFASKDDLVAAYVDRCSIGYRTRLIAVSASTIGTPRDRILAVIDAFEDEAFSGTCRGCPFLLAIAEFPDPANPAHIGAVKHKVWLRALFHELVGELVASAGLPGADGLADGLTLVAEGIYGAVQSLGPSGPVRQGRACAEALIDVFLVRGNIVSTGPTRGPNSAS